MDLELLNKCGISPREAKVYMALLKIGLSTVGPIVKESKVPSSKIYETLDRLKEKGFVSMVIRNRKKHFQASDPESILAVFEEQHSEIQDKLIPKLKLLKIGNRPYNATVYEGSRSFKIIYERMLREGGEILVLGAPLHAQELLEPFSLNWNSRRTKKKIPMKIIYQKEAKEYGKKRKKMPFTKVRYMKKELTPAWIDIFADCVVIFDLSRDKPLAFLIQSRGIAENYKQYFKTVWKDCA